jgi:hypothetical protein
LTVKRPLSLKSRANVGSLTWSKMPTDVTLRP